MTADDELLIRVEERDHLLLRATNILRDDPRIVAAWLLGSLGSGTQDDWSDLDLWIVVGDESMREVAHERHKFSGRVAQVLLLEDAPQNAPPGGAFLSAMFKGQYGPQIVDIYWQPLSSAQRPPGTTLLFEKLGVPAAPSPAHVSHRERLAKAVEQTQYVWMMVAITAKSVARRDSWKVLRLMTLTWSGLQQVRWFVGELAAPPDYSDQPDFAPPLTEADQVAALRVMAAKMAELASKHHEIGTSLSSDIAQQTELLLSLVERSLA